MKDHPFSLLQHHRERVFLAVASSPLPEGRRERCTDKKHVCQSIRSLLKSLMSLLLPQLMAATPPYVFPGVTLDALVDLTRRGAFSYGACGGIPGSRLLMALGCGG